MIVDLGTPPPAMLVRTAALGENAFAGYLVMMFLQNVDVPLGRRDTVGRPRTQDGDSLARLGAGSRSRHRLSIALGGSSLRRDRQPRAAAHDARLGLSTLRGTSESALAVAGACGFRRPPCAQRQRAGRVLRGRPAHPGDRSHSAQLGAPNGPVVARGSRRNRGCAGSSWADSSQPAKFAPRPNSSSSNPGCRPRRPRHPGPPSQQPP